MPSHAACCCGGTECYCGTLCLACESDCVSIEPFACILASEYESHIDELPGSGAGAIIAVGGAYYFFSGSKGSCSTTPADPDDIDWEISFRADACPDPDDVISFALPFIGGWDFTESWSVSIDAEGVVSYVTAGCTSAPVLHPITASYVNTSSDPVDRYYGSLADTSVSVSEGHVCAGNSDFEDNANSCPLSALPAWANSIAVFAEAGDAPGTSTGNVAIITVRNDCPDTDHTLELYVDADGYQNLCINSATPCSGDPTPCKIRFVGSADTFVAFANARFAGTGLTFAMSVSTQWFVGCKARFGFEGTASQPLFPAAALSFGGSATATITMGGGTGTIHIDDATWLIPDTTMAMAGYTDSTCAACAGGGGISGCGGPADVFITPTTSVWSGNYVREIYGVTINAKTFAYQADGAAYGGLGLKNPNWTVS